MIRYCEKCGKEIETTKEHEYFCKECFKKLQEDKKKLEDYNNFIAFQEIEYKKCRIQKEFWFKTLKDFIPENESHSEAVKAALELIKGDIQKLILIGKNGLGKSHIANAICYELKGIRYSFYELYALYRDAMKNGGCESEVITELKKYPVIVLEEAGKTKGSIAELNFLSLLIDELHANNKKIVITSNNFFQKDCMKKKQQGNCSNCDNPKCFEAYFNNDSLSRLNQKSKKIVMYGNDYRARGEK